MTPSDTKVWLEKRVVVRSGDSLKITGDSAAHVIVRWRFDRVKSAIVNGAAVKVRTDAAGDFVEFDHLKESLVAWQ